MSEPFPDDITRYVVIFADGIGIETSDLATARNWAVDVIDQPVARIVRLAPVEWIEVKP